MKNLHQARRGTSVGMVKVHLQGPHAGDSETVWATPLGGALYRLENSPFFAYGISRQDVVQARPGPEGLLEFSQRIERSGHRTVRVILEGYSIRDERARVLLDGLAALGCSVEGMQPRLIAVDVPPGTDLSSVVKLLQRQDGIQWEYADPTYEEVEER